MATDLYRHATVFSSLRKLLQASTISTQLFIETPYRSTKLFTRLLQLSSASQLLCVACCLGISEQLLTDTYDSCGGRRVIFLHTKTLGICTWVSSVKLLTFEEKVKVKACPTYLPPSLSLKVTLTR